MTGGYFDKKSSGNIEFFSRASNSSVKPQNERTAATQHNLNSTSQANKASNSSIRPQSAANSLDSSHNRISKDLPSNTDEPFLRERRFIFKPSRFDFSKERDFQSLQARQDKVSDAIRSRNKSDIHTATILLYRNLKPQIYCQVLSRLWTQHKLQIGDTILDLLPPSNVLLIDNIDIKIKYILKNCEKLETIEKVSELQKNLKEKKYDKLLNQVNNIYLECCKNLDFTTLALMENKQRETGDQKIIESVFANLGLAQYHTIWTDIDKKLQKKQFDEIFEKYGKKQTNYMQQFFKLHSSGSHSAYFLILAMHDAGCPMQIIQSTMRQMLTKDEAMVILSSWNMSKDIDKIF
ncbi:MAG: hypothetical protein MHMPM18_000338 [Marteilia pararefringens]